MVAKGIRRSFHLDSEPVLDWPQSPTKLQQLNGYKLEYSGNGMKYSLPPETAGLVDLVGWDPSQGFAGWRNIFSESQWEPTGLLKLAQLNKDSTAQAVREWTSTNGLLGFHPVDKEGGHFIPFYVGNTLINRYEPIDCILSAAQRAANVLALWSALKKSYVTGQGSIGVQEISSIVSIEEDEQDSGITGSRVEDSTMASMKELEKTSSVPISYRTLVNGEDRGRWPLPKSPRDWRELANVLLSEYIQEHIYGEIEIAVGVQAQKRDEEERHTEPSPDWNLKPTWRIQSALASYYVELLMVMRRLRSCKTCGRDISHQSIKSKYCTAPSTCRTKDWHRGKAAKKKSSRRGMLDGSAGQ